MRSFLLALSLIGCSDYEINPISTEEPAMPPSSSSDVLADEPETNEEDVGTEAPTDTAVVTEEPTEDVDTGDELISSDECGFLVNQWLGNPDVETESLAIFTNVGDLHFEIRQSETARYQFAVTALECGDIDFNQTFLQVDDEACDTEDCWIGDIALDYIPMNLTNMTDGITYEPYDLSQQVHNLVYGWHDEDTGGAYAMMDTVHVAAGTTKIFEFDFTATNDIPIGNTIRIFLVDPIWTDNVTGNDVWNVDDGGTELAVTYTIVE
mgnify:CR=1 FL=1